ncbi:unnamed protein product [Rangifer tarandus platyrhynchus]|uniref:Uncharacterized protein n=2 Tax=Rangifer tarandus platyrhynchus TaxID=3082113 RepID=A0ABN8XS23_RANTA|nr:unnamed protein product [Rangifer tarandus platyrhynchus]
MGTCSLPHGHMYTHTHMSHMLFSASATSSSCPSQKWPARCLSVCPLCLSLGEDTELSLCCLRPGACTLWISQTGFSSFLSIWGKNLQDCFLGPPVMVPKTGSVIPRQALAGPRHNFDGRAPLRPEGRSEAAGVLGWSSAEVAGLGGARAKGPAAPMRELFYSLGLRGVLGAFF